MSLRVVLLCLGLAVFFGYVVPIVDVKMSNTFVGAQHLPPGAVGVLLVLVLVLNPLLRALSKRFAFSRNEILTVYITCLFSTMVPGHGGEAFFVSQVLGPFYYATRENDWLNRWQQYLPEWMSPVTSMGGAPNLDIARGWYDGMRPGASIPWDAWVIPLLAWSSVIFAMYAALACLSVMLRAQWGEHEALAFPLLRLPLEMTEDVDREDKFASFGRFFRTPLMWGGFGLAVSIQLLNGLNKYFPDVPRVPLNLDTGPLFSEAPWNQIGTTPIFVWPMVVGITYLLTSEVSFSLWFFFWFVKLQLIFAYYLGFVPNTLPQALMADGRTFVHFQRMGAFLAYSSIVLWIGRAHFKHIALRALGRVKAGPGERNEALSYPVAFWGFMLSTLFILGWSVVAGIRFDLALTLWLITLVMFIALTRLIVEGGLLLITPSWMPMGVLGQMFNSGPGTWLSPANGLVPANFLQSAIVADPRSFSMPNFMMGFKLAHDHKIPGKKLLALIFAVIAISFAMSCWMRIRLGYENGGNSLQSWYFREVGAQLPAWYTNDLYKGVPTASWANTGWLGVGIAMVWILMMARSRLAWFPLHPLGFLMSLTWSMQQVWFSIFMGWSAKVLMTRFGGPDTYRKTTPFFLGLILGDITMMLFWICIDGWQGVRGHHLTPD